MKKSIFFAAVLLMMTAAALAMAAPGLSGVYASDTVVRTGEAGFSVAFSASEAGVLAFQLIGEDGEALDIGAKRIEAGEGRVDWNGLLPDGGQPEPGEYTIVVRMKNDAGEESGMCMIGVVLQNGQASDKAPLAAGMLDLSALVIEEAAVWEEGQEALDEEASEETAQDEIAESGEYLLDENGVPVATSFWDMQPDAYDLDNPAHQQAIWDLMMQPITVIDGDQTENIYITNKPGISARPYAENCAGELHGQSQGVRIVEDDTDGDGYVLIEAYTNDGTKSESEYMESIAAQKVQGYIKKSRLYTEVCAAGG